MSRLHAVTLAAAGLAVAGTAALAFWPIGEPVDLAGIEGDAERGAYLARAGGCIACHSDPGSGKPALSGGAPIRTGFGTFVPPNLTTHEAAGLGGWDVSDFARAVRQGISPEGEAYYPAFPHPFYAKLSDRDVADLWAAFRTVPPHGVPAPPHEVAFPFNLRFGLKLWRAAFGDAPSVAEDPTRSEAWNRGRWLVNGLAHCGACHTDRNALGGRIAERRLAGSDDLPGGGKAPPITPEALKEDGWTVSSLSFALKSGVMPDGDTFGGGMGEVVQEGTAWLRPEDREAMARFLLDDEAAGDGS
ncbi:c-type cytochrome [Salipiger mucosus]|uniref:Putative diheme cytochrome c-553 n=1 Tax=Salipiger mucosus DSM 16094 TaxID=1123237 RepID=S9RVW1_9RHOB|nr:cytochrome c [Salipiger mucosus]EPX82135.1 Putative diheme cytochrome c-553 [Salipiger mucosus DSM 16094]